MKETSDQNTSYQKFWTFFSENKETFFQVVKSHEDIEGKFLDIIAPELKSINEDLLYLTGMFDENTAELIITVDGNIKDIVYAEEFIQAAPALQNWRFTALKPESNIEDTAIVMEDYEFTKENVFFYSNDDENYPDEIDLTFIHEDLNDDNRNEIANGTFIFIDNYLGELNFLTQIDNFRIAGKGETEKELIPIEKLKDYLNWREREFIDKHKGSKIQTNEDSFSLFEATLTNGFPLIATVNTDLLRWNKKASHPWISVLRIEYKGDDESGFPDNEDYEMLNAIEDEILIDLKPKEGDLIIGRETAEHIREIYFASKDFRKISKILAEITRKYPQYNITFEIYKDKYWQSFERYGIH